MTEDSRGSVDNPPRDEDSFIPGMSAGQQDDGPGPARHTAEDIEQVDGPGEEEGAAERRPAGDDRDDEGFAPPDAPGSDRLLVAGPPPPSAVMDRPGPYEGYGRPPAPYPDAPPLVPPAQENQPPPYQEASQYGQEPARSGRPGFVPHNQEEPGRYGWPAARHQAPPPPPSGPPLAGPPRPGPPGAGQPPPPSPGMSGMGGSGGGMPNWAPVPPPTAPSRGAPSLTVLVVVAAIVALVAGAVGAGVGVMASDDSSPSSNGVSLGGGTGTSGSDAGPQRPPDSVAGVAQRVLPSVVMIQVAAGQESGAGTGFIVNGGYIVTNNHVVEAAAGGGQIEVVFNDKKTSTATIKGRDATSDIAVLQPQTTHNLPALTLGNSDQIAVGDPVIAIGSPLGLQGSVTTGIVSSKNRAVPTGGQGGGDSSYLNAIQTDAAINPGNSGGPLVDARGRVIGINTAIATLGGGGLGAEGQSGSIGLGFAIPINQAKRVAEEIINTGSVKQARIGVLPDPQYQGNGAKIMDQPVNGQQPVTPDGPADKAGLKPGDVITAIDGQPIENATDLIAQIRSRAPGQKVKITYLRGGREATAEVTLAAG